MSETPRKPGNGLKTTGILLLVIVLLSALVYSLRAPLLTGLANYLISTDTPLEKADMIFVLNGDYETRPFYSSELYKQGLAPIVAIAQTESSPAERLGLVDNQTDIAVEVMILRGVPEDKLLVLNTSGSVTSTFDEASTLRQYVEANNIHSVIMVTSAFHTRRSRWIFERELAGVQVRLQVAGAPYPNYDAGNWWQHEDGLINLNNEYIKLVFYLIKYR
jgi:uncharacterized SAM-binding protein YcdF (DUF218 family)